MIFKNWHVITDAVLHAIDLQPRAILPNCPTYRMNLEEIKELKRQVDELAEKGICEREY